MELRSTLISGTSEECIMLGYASSHEVYRLWSLKVNEVIVCQDTIFFDDFFPFYTISLPSTNTDTHTSSPLQPDVEADK